MGMLYKEKSDLEFFECEEPPLEFIYNINKIILDPEREKEYPLLYNEDIKDYCNDTKVIEKKGVKKLLKWREKMRIELGLEEAEDGSEGDDEDEKENEDAEDSEEEEIKEMEKEELQHMKDQFKE